MWHSGKVQVLHLSLIWPASMLWGELRDGRRKFTRGVPITAFLFSACTVPCSQSSSQEPRQAEQLSALSSALADAVGCGSCSASTQS